MYLLGFLTPDGADPADRETYLRTGHPDGSAFHHDLYQGCCNGRWWVMEQQPGPVNWAPFNPSPLSGMVRLRGWEAFAHGAEVMSWFRWRQLPIAQEQTHARLLLSNGQEDNAAGKVTLLNPELQQLASYPVDELSRHELHTESDASNDVMASTMRVRSDVAIVFRCEGIALQNIQSPGGSNHTALSFCQRLYSACRQRGANVDIVAPEASLATCRLILICTGTVDDAGLLDRLNAARSQSNPVIALFPGTGCRDSEFSIPGALPPGRFEELLPVKVVRSESLPDTHVMTAKGEQGRMCNCTQWRERVVSDIVPQKQFDHGWGFHYERDRVHYLNSIPDRNGLVTLVGELLDEANLPCRELGPHVRTQRVGPYRMAFNYGRQSIELDKHLGDRLDFHHDLQLLVGAPSLKQAEEAVWIV